MMRSYLSVIIPYLMALGRARRAAQAWPPASGATPVCSNHKEGTGSLRRLGATLRA